jgi:hypothetical protein
MPHPSAGVVHLNPAEDPIRPVGRPLINWQRKLASHRCARSKRPVLLLADVGGIIHLRAAAEQTCYPHYEDLFHSLLNIQIGAMIAAFNSNCFAQ